MIGLSENIITFEDLKIRLTPAQRKAAELIVANDFAPKGEKKTLGQISEEVGVNQRTLYNWRQNPDFTRYVGAVSDGELSNYRSLADSQLIRLIAGEFTNNGTPAIKALELFYKLEGRLVDRSVVMRDDEHSNPQISRAELSEELQKLNKYVN